MMSLPWIAATESSPPPESDRPADGNQIPRQTDTSALIEETARGNADEW